MSYNISSHEIYKTVAPYLPENPVIIEAGAFLGHDTLKMAQQWPQATIHAFEPVPELYLQLIERVKHVPTIICHNNALSNATGKALLHIAQKPDKPEKITQASSLHKPTGRLEYSPIIYPHTLEIATITVDDWAKKYNINHIDFFWFDMQGHELAALQGAQQMLKSVKALYTEVNFIHGYEGQPLAKEVIAWVEDHGFQELARTYTNETDWFFGEILFIRTTE